jgi:hypothetical protein
LPAGEPSGIVGLMKALRAAVLSPTVFLASTAGLVSAAPVPKDVASYLEGAAKFPPDRVAALEGGQVIVKTTTDDENEVSVAGAARIRATKEQIERYFDQYMRYEDGSVVLQVGRFSNPPVLEDVSRLRLEDADIDALRECKPGNCDVKIGASFAQLRAGIDWGAPDYRERVNALVRQRIVDYVKAYMEKGDAALVTYGDKAEPVSLARQWQALLAKSPFLYGYAPQLQQYLQGYPRSTLPGGHDFIQWSKVDLGLKPVVSVTHVVLYQDPARPDRFSAALKQIYATHYHEGGFSFVTVVDAQPAGPPPTCYVVFVNRTRTDMFRGGLGAMKRKVAGNELLKGTEVTLQQIQEVLEKAAGVR